ncbi:putative O Protein-disulfide isomerase [Waddlia chondrophila 2032/99]|uniref:Putative O Protein-disulfide isomerase n=1 Tax=Waddlia chondrophila 2032/99 TaxID=765953 RepID=F8LCZ6_9BACT|nr:putative O Protein-disulfide isomerase [Waddlia chondrophila 2032/99]
MDMQTHTNRDKKLWLAAQLAVIAGLVLTIISILKLCSAQCAEGHNWRLFGLPFEALGGTFFTLAAIGQWLSRKNLTISHLQFLFLGTAVGAEIYFIYVQKVHIGSFCPVCLGIAFCLAIAFMIQGIRVYQSSQEIQEKTMLTKWKSLTSTTAIGIGLLVAFLGVTKKDAMQAAQNSIKENIAFGNQNSNIEVYLFTDWACPACRKLEPNLKRMVESIDGDAKFFFIDHAIHPETLNYVPYNLSFIINNKPKYFELRDMLTELSKTNSSPSEDLITKEANQHGVKYTELSYAEIALAIKYYKKLGEKFKVKGTPTLVIINTETKKGKKLSGNNEITEENLVKSIETLK